MKNNKIVIYVGILALGLVLGWLFFGGSSKDNHEHSDTMTAETNQMWTCSMHPQIMQSEPGDCPICGMDLIPAEVGAEGLAADQFKLSKNALALANIQTTVVGNSEANENRIKLTGKIQPNEEANTVQVSYFSGRIERLNVSFTGEEIRKGQLLATVYSPQLYAAQQELLTASSLKESQPELYKAVRNKLKLWKLSENQINQIEISGEVKENFPVYATVSGTVSKKLIEQGDVVKQGQPLLKITDLSTVWAQFDAYENQIDLFKVGQSIDISTNAFPNETYKAKISFIDPVINTRTRTISVRAVLQNNNDRFKPGMFIQGLIQGDSSNSKTVITVPKTAILWTGERSVVYLKMSKDQPVFEMREVTLGNISGDMQEIVEGLSDGDEVVTNGAFTVDAAAQLQGKKSMMNKDGEKTSSGHKDHPGMEESALNVTERIEVDSKFQDQLKTVFDAYIALKNELVEDDVKSTKSKATLILEQMGTVNMKLLSDNKAHTKWMTLEKEIKSASNEISKSNDIMVQRNHFKTLSTHLTKAVQLFGVNETVYSQYCPMADNNSGGYWLSLENEIRNPYFGDAMLKCGSVKQTIN
ncbi:MAG: efflux RND transporter periplasmic adaptor subunit [Flavobacteriaceae bacterium]|nr:efflux RND transporter periplasmic adaptor subunit [Flavobacteriaceae bacterium]RZW52246.1 MAG: efflux RND transporter periplasmic adaptor subunit [Flavobacteriaceae bacterium]